MRSGGGGLGSHGGLSRGSNTGHPLPLLHQLVHKHVHVFVFLLQLESTPSSSPLRTTGATDNYNDTLTPAENDSIVCK